MNMRIWLFCSLMIAPFALAGCNIFGEKRAEHSVNVVLQHEESVLQLKLIEEGRNWDLQTAYRDSDSWEQIAAGNTTLAEGAYYYRLTSGKLVTTGTVVVEGTGDLYVF